MLAETVLLTWAGEPMAYCTENTPKGATALGARAKRWSLHAKDNSVYLKKCQRVYLALAIARAQA